MTKSNTSRFVGAAWSLLIFQFVASAGAVAITAWAALEVQPRLRTNTGLASVSISGELQVGGRAGAQFAPDPDGMASAPSFQWLRDGVAIPNAKGEVYSPGADDGGHSLSVRADYVDGAGNTESVTSAAAEVVAAAVDTTEPPAEPAPPGLADPAAPPADAAPPAPPLLRYPLEDAMVFRQRPAFGSIDLSSSFGQHALEVRAGGAYDAAGQGPGCNGFITSQPSYLVRFGGSNLPLHIRAVSAQDTTIVVRAPDGSVRCNDDNDNSFNPRVIVESPPSGLYQIWVGRYGVQNELAVATLQLEQPVIIR